MLQLCDIPIIHPYGIYKLSDFEQNTQKGLTLEYQEAGEILTYEVPDFEYGKQITLYGIPRDDLENTLQASYNEEGHLKKITATVQGREMLLYIYYENAEDAKKQIEQFATENADVMLKTICQCHETVSRLFIEYFDDGEYIDIHAKIGTENEKIELEQKYPDYGDIADSCGDYQSELIMGDNTTLKVLVLCADDEEMDFLHLAVDTTAARLRQEAEKTLKMSDDFKVLCIEYD